MRVLLRKVHRWLGLLMAVQIIAWMSSGFYFSLFPISEIRGEHLTREPESIVAANLVSAGSAEAVLFALDEHFEANWTLESVALTTLDGSAFWQAEGMAEGLPFRRLVDPVTSEVKPALSADQAERRAAWWLREPRAAVASARVEPGSGGYDLRGRHTAAWKVEFAGNEPVTLYIDPWTGDLLARRTARWRLFDFLWMLHIMDYDTREDFNHPLLQIAALLGLTIALSGVSYWFLTRRRRQRV